MMPVGRCSLPATHEAAIAETTLGRQHRSGRLGPLLDRPAAGTAMPDRGVQERPGRAIDSTAGRHGPTPIAHRERSMTHRLKNADAGSQVATSSSSDFRSAHSEGSSRDAGRSFHQACHRSGSSPQDRPETTRSDPMISSLGMSPGSRRRSIRTSAPIAYAAFRQSRIAWMRSARRPAISDDRQDAFVQRLADVGRRRFVDADALVEHPLSPLIQHRAEAEAEVLKERLGLVAPRPLVPQECEEGRSPCLGGRFTAEILDDRPRLVGELLGSLCVLRIAQSSEQPGESEGGYREEILRPGGAAGQRGDHLPIQPDERIATPAAVHRLDEPAREPENRERSEDLVHQDHVEEVAGPSARVLQPVRDLAGAQQQHV